jgi:carbamoyl-phosphate synthase large subunit
MALKKLKDINVILTGAGAPGWPDICKCLADNNERNIRIVAVDMDPDGAGYHLVPDYCVIPKGSSPHYIEKMTALARHYQADAIVPLTDFELLPLARHKETLKKMGVVVPVASVPALEIATDKIRLHECLGQADPSTPAFSVAHTLQGFESSVYTLGYPDKKVCFKPGIAHGSRGFRILDPQAAASKTFFTSKVEEMLYAMTLENAKSLLGEINGFPPLLLTEFLPGTEYSVDLR